MRDLPAPLATGEATSRWTCVTPTLLGDSTATFAVTDDALVYTSDDAFDSATTVRWSDVRDAATAIMSTASGGPDKPRWVPSRLEWIVLTLTDGRTVMRRLPTGDARDRIVAAVRGVLASRWRGEHLPLADAQRGGTVSTADAWLKLAGLFIGFFVLAFLAIVVLAVLLTPFVLIPVAIVLGGWALRRARAGLRAGAIVGDHQATPIATASNGIVHVAGHVSGSTATPAAASGIAAVWWDVAVYLIGHEEGVDDWNQVAGRHGGAIDTLTVEDGSGRIPVWLDGAELLLTKRSWQSGVDTLPPAGVALLAELGFAWDGAQRIRVIEESLDADAMLSIVGTRSLRGELPSDAQSGLLKHAYRLIATGEWRRALVAALPMPLRPTFAVFIGYVDMMSRLGFARERPLLRVDTPAPTVPAATALVWQGRAGSPFLVSNQPLPEALALLRQRSLLRGGIGVALLLFAAYQAKVLLVGH